MRRLLTWLVVTLGVAAILRRLRRRRSAPAEQYAPADQDPADELRRKLAESRVVDEEQPAEPPTTEDTVEERRAEVHEQGRSALDEMREPDES